MKMIVPVRLILVKAAILATLYEVPGHRGRLLDFHMALYLQGVPMVVQLVLLTEMIMYKLCSIEDGFLTLLPAGALEADAWLEAAEAREASLQ
jgi:hypothetical protein